MNTDQNKEQEQTHEEVKAKKKASRFHFGKKREISILEPSVIPEALESPEPLPEDIPEDTTSSEAVPSNDSLDDALAMAGYEDVDAVAVAEPDTEDDKPPAFKLIKKSKKKISLKTMYIAAASIAIVILFLVVAFMLITHFAVSPYPEGTVPLMLHEFAPADEGYIYTSKTYIINGLETRLLGCMPDPQTLVLSFDRYFDINYFDFYIEDSNGKTYLLDLSRHIDGGRTNKLYFEPLDEGIEIFELFLPNYVVSGFDNNFFYFDKPLSYEPLLYADTLIEHFYFDEYTAYISIDSLSFSRAGARINYGITSAPELRITPASDNIIKLLLTPPIDGFAAMEISDNGNVLGADFYRSPSQFQSDITAEFTNLLFNIGMNKNVETADLFLNDPAKMIEIPFLGNTLILERMGQKGNVFVLVLHTINASGDRIKVDYDIELHGRDADGKQVILQPTSRVFERGADFVFTDTNESIQHGLDVYLLIKSASLKMPVVSFNISLKDLFAQNPNKTVQDAVLAKFNESNKNTDIYKASIIALNNTDNEITAIVYEAVINGEEKYTAKHIITGIFKDGSFYIAGE